MGTYRKTGDQEGRSNVGVPGRSTRRGAFGAVALASLLMGTAATALAQTAAAQSDAGQQQSAQTYAFDMQAQPLPDALNTFSSVTGWEVGYPADLAIGAQAPAVSGSYTPEQALSRLLAGTGLSYQMTGANTVKLSNAGTDQTGKVSLSPITVESALRSETAYDRLTRSVTVLDQEDVQKQKRTSDRTVGEILAQEVPGFSPSTEANSDFGQTLRGRTFQVLIDGVPQNTPLRDGRRSLNTIDPEAIERVEVVRGGTAAYGFGAQGGLVNIITDRPEDGALNFSATGGVQGSATHPDDSLGTDTSLKMSGRQGKVDYLASGTFLTRGGRFDADGDRIPADPLGVQGGISDSETVNLLGKVGFQLTDDQRVQVSGLYYDMAQDSDFAGISFAGDPDTGRKTPAVRGDANVVNPGTENTNLNLEYTHADVWGSSLDAQLYYAEQEVTFGRFPGFQQSTIASEKFGGRVTVDTPVAFEPLPFNLTWGVDALADTTQTITYGQGASAAAPKLDQTAFAGFAQAEVPIGDIMVLNGGIRHEIIEVDAPDFQQSGGNVVEGGTIGFDETLFNVGATVFVTDRLDLFGSFSQSFNVTELGRVLSTFPFDRAEQAETEAEIVDNYEVGVRYTEERWDASIVGFLNESDGGVTFDQNLNIVRQPERIYGVEFAANARPVDMLEVGSTVTWMEGRVDLDGDGDYEEDLPSTRIPPVKVTGFVEVSPEDWWSVRLQGLYSGNRDVDGGSLFGNTSDIEDYVVFDLYGEMDAGPGQLRLGVQNLFNNEYTPVVNQAYDRSFAYARAPGTTVSLAYSVDF
jgi:iron complex outermembrane receptor protein